MIKYISEQNDLAGKTVILRADLDAPHDGAKILNDFRLRQSCPTINFLRDQGAKVVILSKTGKPKGEDESESLVHVARRLSELLNMKLAVFDDHLPDYDLNHLVFFKADIREDKNLEIIKSSPAKDVIILENVRFYPEEKDSDPVFAKNIASIGDYYVNDAFAMVHRNEATITLIPQFLPSFGGLNLERELKFLDKFLKFKADPFVMIIGGAKISDKIGTVKNLGKEADSILVGGGPANLFMHAKGMEIGKSICEEEDLHAAQEFLRNFKGKIVLPKDFVVAEKRGEEYENVRVCKAEDVGKNDMILDIGSETILEFSKIIKRAKKMVWSGPLGYFEKSAFSHGTKATALVFAAQNKGPALGLIGGGDTSEALEKTGVLGQIDFVSTAGSAMLDFLAGEELPGLKALDKSGQ